MATRINSVTVNWTAYTEGTTQNAVIDTLANESVFSWGVPSKSRPSSIGVKGMMPPIRVPVVGTSFRLLRFRYDRQPITVTSGTYPKTITCSAAITVDGEAPVTITVKLKHTYGTGTFQIDPSTSRTVTVAGRSFYLNGFEVLGAAAAESFSAEKSQTVDAYLIATLRSEPAPSVGTDPVFDPDRCEIPHVDPIPDIGFLDDCTVPPDIEPIIDCPEIDLPSVGAIGLQILMPEPGPPGDDGPPGQDGQDGCNPKITVSYDYYCVTDCTKVKVVIETIPVQTCWTHFHYKFYLCCPYYYSYGAGCNLYVWCPCPEYVEGVDYTYPTVDDSCPKTSTCGSAPGHWVALGGTATVDIPCTTGTYYGQTELVCECPTSSSSSSPVPPDTTCCPDRSPMPTTLYLTSFASGCANLTFTDLALGQVSDTCWVGHTPEGFSFSLCCVNTGEGVYKYRLTVTRAADFDCVLIAENTPESCDPFTWSANARQERLDCCSEGTGGPFTATFDVTETP